MRDRNRRSCAEAKDRPSSGLNGGKSVSGLFACRRLASLFVRDDKGSVAILARSQRLVSWPTAKRPPGVDSIPSLPRWTTPCCWSFLRGGGLYGADTGREAAGSFWLNVAPPPPGWNKTFHRATNASRGCGHWWRENENERGREGEIWFCGWLLNGWWEVEWGRIFGRNCSWDGKRERERGGSFFVLIF